MIFSSLIAGRKKGHFTVVFPGLGIGPRVGRSQGASKAMVKIGSRLGGVMKGKVNGGVVDQLNGEGQRTKGQKADKKSF